ncbi:MAG: hypothetical protein IT365_15615 [Candidatus Hydrogenedentes bacterium]|nr:hypothetical protein [Candidatus Hydrogenedentota bacterium]
MKVFRLFSLPYIRFTLLFAGLWVCFGPGSTALAQDPNPPSIRSNQGAWPIRRQWNTAETKHYAQWVENIYKMKTKGNVEQRTAKLERILTDPEMNLLLDPAFAGEGSNPQLPKGTIRFLHSVVDCAKLTATFPAYYAYRRALPWMSTYVSPVKGDSRISPNNIPVGFESSFTSPSVDAFFKAAITGFGSGNYRVEPNNKNSQWSDSVPVAINRDFLMPGCMNYTDGHCLILAEVDKYGELKFLNASTTVTKDIFTYNGMNTVVGINPMDPSNAVNPLTGCFQGLRVMRYPIAETDKSGRVIKVRRRTDEEMQEFGMSIEQYARITDMTKQHQIEESGIKLQSFHEFIRYRMKTVDQITPKQFMEEYIQEMLDMWKAREVFVQEAWADVQKNGHIVYPEERRDENIFQALGRWETWSSPSSDVDRRTKYFYLADWMDNAIRWYESQPQLVDLTGFEQYEIKSSADLAKAIVAEKNRLFQEKSMTYTNSAGQPVTLTLADIEQRLYDLSFDPNHPPELRWGAPTGSPERATAKETYTPVPDGSRVPMEEAYYLQTYYRSLGQRETEISCLRGMFTVGFPIRDKFDQQLAKWVPGGLATEKLAAK